MTHASHIKTILATIALLLTFAVALPVFAHGDTATETKTKKNVNLSCMQTAVTVRETALLTAFGAFHDDIEEGLEARKTALITAWGLSSGAERTKAIRTAWKTWKTDQKDAHKAFKSARKSAWDTFKSTVKTTCKESLPADEALLKDSSGSISI